MQQDVFIQTPSEGQYIIQGLAPPADYACRDSGSGAASCTGNVASGAPVPTDTLGMNILFTVSATDNIGLEADASRNYNVVPQLVIDGPDEPSLLGNVINITATAMAPLGTIQFAEVEWGDGTTSTLSGGGVTQSGNDFVAAREYLNPGVYPITVKVDDGSPYIRTGVFEFAVIYDPSDGFVTGGGWIDSPAGAYMPDLLDDLDLTG